MKPTKRYRGDLPHTEIVKFQQVHEHSRIVPIFLAGIAVALFAWTVIIGINRNEIMECQIWSTQAKEYPNFYLADWQAKQCASHGITVMPSMIRAR